MFLKNIRTLYLYLVSFLALMGIVFGTVNLVEKVTNYICPIDYTYDRTYYEQYDVKGGYITEPDSIDIDSERHNLQVRTLREIFTSVAILVVSAPLYGYHWTMIQKERKREEV